MNLHTTSSSQCRHRLFTSFLIAALSLASSSSYKYSTYNYDMTTPMFTPDGRLLQVEYAGEAPRHSYPLMAIVIPSCGRSDHENHEDSDTGTLDHDTDHVEDDDVMIVATLLSSSSNIETQNEELEVDDAKPNNPNDLKHQNHPFQQITRAQRRIIQIPIGPPKTTRFNTMHNGGLILGISGVLSDNVKLLKEVQAHMESWCRQYGMHKPHSSTSESSSNTITNNNNISNSISATSTAYRISKILGDACQQNSFGGGIRPFGASALICAMESHPNQQHSKWAMYTTYPSGSILKHTAMDANSSMNMVLVGGEATHQQSLRTKVESNMRALELPTSNIKSNPSVSTVVQAVIAALCADYETQLISKGYLKRNTKHDSMEDTNSHSQNQSLETIQSMFATLRANGCVPLMEIAILSGKGGVQYLEQGDIYELINMILNSSSTILEEK